VTKTLKRITCAAIVAACMMLPSQMSAAPFGVGDLVVVQVGDGTATLGTAGAAINLKEFTTSGSLVSTTNIPNRSLAGSSTSEGFLALSADGNYLTMGAYNANPGTAGVVASTSAAINRSVVRVDMNQVVNSTTLLNDAYSGGNIRSAVSDDGFDLWTGGSNASVRYTTLGATTSTQLAASPPNPNNVRVVKIFNGQLYVSASTSTGPLLGVGTVGSGTPTTSGQTITALSGMPTTGTHSNYDFWFKDANTLYMTDDGSAANGGGIQKWTQSGGTWSLQYIMLNNGTTSTSVRGITGYVDGSGNSVLFATNGLALLTVTDTGVDNDVSTTLATAGANFAFRGIAYVPEPAGLALLGIACVAGLRRRRV
jgi:hypothetical protein